MHTTIQQLASSLYPLDETIPSFCASFCATSEVIGPKSANTTSSLKYTWNTKVGNLVGPFVEDVCKLDNTTFPWNESQNLTLHTGNETTLHLHTARRNIIHIFNILYIRPKPLIRFVLLQEKKSTKWKQ